MRRGFPDQAPVIVSAAGLRLAEETLNTTYPYPKSQNSAGAVVDVLSAMPAMVALPVLQCRGLRSLFRLSGQLQKGTGLAYQH